MGAWLERDPMVGDLEVADLEFTATPSLGVVRWEKGANAARPLPQGGASGPEGVSTGPGLDSSAPPDNVEARDSVIERLDCLDLVNGGPASNPGGNSWRNGQALQEGSFRSGTPPLVGPGVSLEPSTADGGPEALALQAIARGRRQAKEAEDREHVSVQRRGLDRGYTASTPGPVNEAQEWEDEGNEEEGEQALSWQDPSPRAAAAQVRLPPGLRLPRRAMHRLREFHRAFPVSPFQAGREARSLDHSTVGAERSMDHSTVDAERRWVAVVHELLSLTVEKRLLVDQLTHFRKDLRLTQHIYALLVRHPEYFYVSAKGVRHSVFLREAYEGGVLVQKDELGVARERLRRMAHIRHQRIAKEDNADISGSMLTVPGSNRGPVTLSRTEEVEEGWGPNDDELSADEGENLGASSAVSGIGSKLEGVSLAPGEGQGRYRGSWSRQREVEKGVRQPSEKW